MRGFWTADHKRRNGQGFTLVELIVVLAIVALLTALAVPGLSRLGAFSDDTLSQESRQLFELLAAARVYATTYNVRTAVVYNLDTYKSPQVNPTNDPLPPGSFVNDTITGAQVRFVTAATMMYALPNAQDTFGDVLNTVIPSGTKEAFVPANGKEWQWREFDDSVAMLLLEIKQNQQTGEFIYRGLGGQTGIAQDYVYISERPRFEARDDVLTVNGVSSIGMYRGLPVLLDYDGLVQARQSGTPLADQTQYFARFLAHVFTPDGQLDAETSVKERYKFYMGYRPDESRERRLTDPALGLSFIDPDGLWVPNLRVVPMEIYRSTGRVKIAS